ncbi:MAG TPA: glucoamylase family protein, partial [Bacteroidota bacterium]
AYYDGWLKTYRVETWYGTKFFAFPPLFGHQYAQCWFDFRALGDDKNREFGWTYFENSRRATLANRRYCIENPNHFKGYSDSLWGLTACDGPDKPPAKGYFARGAPNPEIDDGTIAPTAAGGSLPFTPKESLLALKTMYKTLCSGNDTRLWGPYGMRDAFNLAMDWVDSDYLGIDQGPMVIMIENFLTQNVWKRFSKIPEIQRGLKAARFQPWRSDNPGHED